MRIGVAAQRHVETFNGEPGTWLTPTATAVEFVSWLDVGSGMSVLDAGAGRGALGQVALLQGARVTLLERQTSFCLDLTRDFGAVAQVVHADFLEHGFVLPPMDLVISNPPFEDDLVERFAIRALDIAPRVGLICPLNLLCGVERSKRFWQSNVFRPKRARALPARPRFGRGNASGGMRDIMFLELERGVPRRTRTGAVILPMEVG